MDLFYENLKFCTSKADCKKVYIYNTIIIIANFDKQVNDFGSYLFVQN